MSFIKGRLTRAEAAARKGPSGRCAECGLLPDGPGRIAVINEEHPEKSFKGVDPDERCGRCGRFLYTVIQVVYEDVGDAGRGGPLRWP